MAPPPPSPQPQTPSPAPIISLPLRILTFIFLLISLIILTTNTATLVLGLNELNLHFKDIYAFRYMVASIVIGIAYTLLQMAFTIYHLSMGHRLVGGDGFYQFDFYGDKAVSYLLATGTAAAFGASVDMKDALSGTGSSVDKFFEKANAAASLLLFAFLFSAVSSVFSAFALPKKIYYN
ncbi:CASP-like protein 4D1 [Malania oleifera]|uniref:CASP-like protein 4D1 n=1 Tax=Malania oleifera TaxID=397392 RepID=UPI0025AE25F8|nr:CASP-like protein 4D1 [Malania oleifera]